MEQRCPYCREVLPETGEEINQEFMKRVKANDPIALYVMGQTCDKQGDHEGAFQYFTKAAALGDIDAHYDLAVTYRDGDGVGKDLKKELHHLEEAAIGGHPLARYNLGANEWNSERDERAMKHYIIAAKLGHDQALEYVKQGFVDGIVNKEDFEGALRGHQAAVDATKSKQREEAYAFHNLSPE
jgi:TPR repeat protein